MSTISKIKADFAKFANPKNNLFRFSLFLLTFSAIATVDLFTGIPDGQTGNRELYKNIFNIVLVLFLYFSLYIFTRYRLNITFVNPFNLLVSSLLIYLLLHPTNLWWLFILAFIGVFAGKYFFTLKNQPIFNPAAFGIIFALYLSKLLNLLGLSDQTLLISWWGADIRQQFLAASPIALQIVIIVLLLAGFVFFARSFKKLKYALFFFFTYGALFLGYNAFVAQVSFTLMSELFAGLLTDATPFLALVMLAEPKTSPITLRNQLYVGIASGTILFVFITMIHDRIAEPFALTILAANSLTFILKQKRFI